MKRFLLFLLFLALAAISIDCSAQEISTKPTTWHGTPGTAVRIRIEKGAFKRLKGSQKVGLWGIQLPPDLPSHWSFPVMKLERRAVTVFVPNDDRTEEPWLITDGLVDAIRKGSRTGMLFVARDEDGGDRMIR
jgi:hypothetical protein